MFDHPFDRVFASEVRDVGELLAARDGQINHALHAGRARQAERVDRLGQFVGRVADQEEQGLDADQRGAHRVGVEQVAFDGGDAGREAGFFG